MFLRTQGCHNCAFATPSDIPRRVTCTHEPTPALLAGGGWPVVYGDDVCGYWSNALQPTQEDTMRASDAKASAPSAAPVDGERTNNTAWAKSQKKPSRGVQTWREELPCTANGHRVVSRCGARLLSTRRTRVTKKTNKTAKNLMLRQGDVLITRVDKMPTNVQPVKRTPRGVVLAEGEVTGHAHRIPSRHASLYRTENDARYMRVTAPVQLKHEEHTTITIPKGTYRVMPHTEYHPEELRRVED